MMLLLKLLNCRETQLYDLLFFLDYARMKPRSSSTSVASSGNSRQCSNDKLLKCRAPGCRQTFSYRMEKSRHMTLWQWTDPAGRAISSPWLVVPLMHFLVSQLQWGRSSALCATVPQPRKIISLLRRELAANFFFSSESKRDQRNCARQSRRMWRL